MAEQKRLSLCVITKNDAAFLPGCLNDLMPTVDETLVIDLGSTDNTVALAKQAGASVYLPDWNDDFSKIKNDCMDRVNGKWVLFLQADETISREQHKELGFLLQNPAAEGYLIKTEDNKGNVDTVSPAQNLRLLRNRANYRYRYRSFEYIPDEELYSIQNCALRITRHRNAAEWQAKEKSRLLQIDIEENPQDGYLRYLKGAELLSCGKFKESAASLELARHAFGGGYLYTPHLYKCLGACFLALKRYDAAEDVLGEGIWLFPLYTDLLVLRAELYHKLCRNDEAVKELETCLNLQARPSAQVPPPEISIADVKAEHEKIRAGCDESHGAL